MTPRECARRGTGRFIVFEGVDRAGTTTQTFASPPAIVGRPAVSPKLDLATRAGHASGEMLSRLFRRVGFPRSLVVTALATLPIASGCGAAAEGSPPASAPSSASTAAIAPRPKVKVTQLSRGGVERVVKEGIGRFLQSVTVDDHPAFRDGKFLGFRVSELRGDLEACDLQPGDVITRVNGRSVERPEDALGVFQSLTTAKELVVEYERGGKPQKLVLPITDGS